MRDVVIAGAGIVFGWLMSKTWSDPACQVGLMLFLVVTAVMALAFAFAVVGHGRKDPEASPEDDDEDGSPPRLKGVPASPPVGVTAIRALGLGSACEIAMDDYFRFTTGRPGWSARGRFSSRVVAR